jgi:Helix-turn-helix domain
MDTDVMTIREVGRISEAHREDSLSFGGPWKNFPGFKVGGSWRFKRSELEKWIERQSTEQKTTGGE